MAAAIAAGVEVEVFLDERAQPPGGAPYVVVAEGVLDRVLDTVSPQGIAAVAAIEALEPDELAARAAGEGRPIVVLDRLQDPGNAGTIMRSALAAGAVGVIATAGTVDLWSPKVVRAAAGASFSLGLALAESLESVAATGVELLGTSSHRGELHTEAELAGGVALVVGNEAAGLEGEDRDGGAGGGAISRWVRIDMDGPAESLNAAMAATVLLFEARRQRAALG